MSLMQTLQTVFTILMLSVGQVLFKLAAARIDVPHKGVVNSFLFNGPLMVAMVVYGGATILWLYVLREAPLQVAYPFVALAFFIVPILSGVFLGEALRWTTFVGAAVILLGVYITTL